MQTSLLSIIFLFKINLILTQYTLINITTQLCNPNNYNHCSMPNAIQYRTISGDCNNIEKQWIGKSYSPMKRQGSSAYNDALGTPRRKGVSGKLLPASRKVAMSINYPNEEISNVTIFHLLYGKMISHDISDSPFPQNSNGRNMVCYCNDTSNPLCLVLPTTVDDVINKDQACMTTPRTLSTNLNWNCRNGFREQINKLTAWLDQSHIYGNNDATAQRLRSKIDSGFLLSQKLPGFNREVFPAFQASAREASQCLRDTLSTPCFESGEGRTNMNTGFTAVQVLFLRQHNLIAQFLKDKNGWIGDKLYQEARRITTALYQHVLYNEWLEVIIGAEMMDRFALRPLKNGTFRGYNSKIIAQINNEFTTAAFRYGHNMVPSKMFKSDENLNNFKTFNLSDLTYTPQDAYVEGGLDAICRGAIKNPGLKADNFYSDGAHNRLYEVGLLLGNSKRNSLSAFDIERGRDHGLRSYNSFRSSVGLATATEFANLTNMIPERITNLKAVYENVADIDLFVGGLCEKNLNGALVGQTFACKFFFN
jgi:peroxidase